jgi:proteasome lid subunit RPN8/RPN11
VTAVLRTTTDIVEPARRHLQGHVEQVGFFLANYGADERSLTLREFRAIPPEGFETQTDYHVTLKDEIRPEIIQWATTAEACLVEAHSHVEGPAAFSSSDIMGFDEWVPHVRWRLRARPYAAIVLAEDTFDAVAWIDRGEIPEQVDRLEVDSAIHRATALTLPRWRELKAWRFR